jgi:hypothetical protein
MEDRRRWVLGGVDGSAFSARCFLLFSSLFFGTFPTQQNIKNKRKQQSVSHT